jgi:hypothetical protein
MDPFDFPDDPFVDREGWCFLPPGALDAWILAQAFPGAGPVSQYLGMVSRTPGTGISQVGSASGAYAKPAFSTGQGPANVNNIAGEAPTLEHLDRDVNGGTAPQDGMQKLNVFGTPSDTTGGTAPQGGMDEVTIRGPRPDRSDRFSQDFWIPTDRDRAGPEIQIVATTNPRTSFPQLTPSRTVPPPPPPAGSLLPPSVQRLLSPDPDAYPDWLWHTPPRRPSLPPLPPPDTSLPPLPPPDPTPLPPLPPPVTIRPPLPPPDFTPRIPGVDTDPPRKVESARADRPENAIPPRQESLAAGRIENTRTVQPERSFWSRGGTGLTAGYATLALGVAGLTVLALTNFWNPVGWVAGAGLALMIAGGAATTLGSAVQLAASYGGSTTAEQDAGMGRAISAPLGYTSVVGALGGVAGTVLAEDPQAGFEQGALWGGLLEGAGSAAMTLPGVLRAIPGIWKAAAPWGKSLLMLPAWAFVGGQPGGGGIVRAFPRAMGAGRRIPPRVRAVEYLGTTPLLEWDKDWAKYQVFATRTRNEAVFRVTLANGKVRVVSIDEARVLSGGRIEIVDAKHGDMGMMFDPRWERKLSDQAALYLGMTGLKGGTVFYPVSTELGATRLAQRFRWEFPDAMSSGQLQVDWVPWRRP